MSKSTSICLEMWGVIQLQLCFFLPDTVTKDDGWMDTKLTKNALVIQI